MLCQLHDASLCRSCPNLDLPLAQQLQLKQSAVQATLAGQVEAAAWLEPFASAPSHFRNKAKLAVSGTTHAPVLGLVDRFDNGTDLTSCPLHVNEIKAALAPLTRAITRMGLQPYSIVKRRGELKHVLITASANGQLMVRFVLRSTAQLPAIRKGAPRLQSELPGLRVLSVNIQPRPAAILEGEREIILSQDSTLDMPLYLPELGADGVVVNNKKSVLPLVLPPQSFFQTNSDVAAGLYAQARAWARDYAGGQAVALTGEPGAGGAHPDATQSSQSIWDLYCGVGGFALALAQPGAQVLGVEVSAPAIDGARAAAAQLGLTSPQVRFEAGDASVLDASGQVYGHDKPDLLVVNPPRRGIGELAASIEGSGIKRVLYSSCNPASLAKDLEVMSSYRVRRARLFDMFLYTNHAEVLVELIHN
ncbi:MAG: methyltransferase domain-containing protein [Actinomyces graevenitzii]|nr:methyltransferase domain-containing protein [Actinomyces graevenitzii]